ncbi:hypothetical protein POM88_033978 [Heracleum sosnowskyi]|uniref:Uncharacterized protein n=1 Tax=Heracleum sosnowskyi TaxID=360622 RepID=A0AAD8HJV1_9APIA|nr:hypothetical protein POM88_033978 [Heracleum sosnowskyi]
MEKAQKSVNDLKALMEMNGLDESSEVEIKEEMVVEVMHELWKEINSCYTPASFPTTGLGCFSGVGGDNERCGAVISDVGSTVMAGVGMGPTNGYSGEKVGGGGGVVKGRDLKCGCSMKHGGGKMDGYDGGEFDDEWLTSVLSMDPQELEDLVVDP